MRKVTTAFVVIVVFVIAFAVSFRIAQASSHFTIEDPLYHVHYSANTGAPQWYREHYSWECYGSYCKMKAPNPSAREEWAWPAFSGNQAHQRWYAYVPKAAQTYGPIVYYHVHEGSHWWSVSVNQSGRAGQWVYLGYSDTSNYIQQGGIVAWCNPNWYPNTNQCSLTKIVFWDPLETSGP